MKPWIVMRAHNDMPLVAETLAGLSRQDTEFRLLALDNASEDGTREALARVADRLIDVPRGQYVPGRVLNTGMRETEGDFVVFLNSDCTPQHPEWLKNLLAGFQEDPVCAVFGRQVPRPDCATLHAKDTEDTYGDGRRQAFWRHCFSMASSAIRRSTWARMPFDEALTYSEDIDWTWRARQGGGRIVYVPGAVVMHSHNYTLRALYRRHFGEGRAEARIFAWSSWERSVLRYSILPFARQVVSDARHCIRRGDLAALVSSPVVRAAQMLGRRAGFLQGLAEASGAARSGA